MQLIFLATNYKNLKIMEYDDNHSEEYLQDEHVEDLIYDIFNYTEEEIHRIIADYELRIPYKDAVERLAFTIFQGDMTKFKLLDYFFENFNQTNKSFTDLTKFNQIFYFLNEKEKVSKDRYKELVLKRYSFEYNGRDIKGETSTHQKTLENLEILFNESHKE